MASITDSMDVNLSKLWELVEDRGAWRAAVREAAKSLQIVTEAMQLKDAYSLEGKL